MVEACKSRRFFMCNIFSRSYYDIPKLYTTCIASKNDANRGAFSRTSKINGWKTFTISAKSSILDVWHSTVYTSWIYKTFFESVEIGVNSFSHIVENGETYFKHLAVQTRHFFKSMFGHFSTLCMKDLTKHYLNQVFILIKS